jgi:hypothetical protein
MTTALITLSGNCHDDDSGNALVTAITTALTKTLITL